MAVEIYKKELISWDQELRRSGRKILLVVDDCSAHPNISDQLSNIKIVFLPLNCTSVLQPMDQVVIRSFKVNYRNNLLSKVVRFIDKNEIFRVSILMELNIIESSWENVKEETIIKCCNYSQLSNCG